jgi:hypothetical protein
MPGASFMRGAAGDRVANRDRSAAAHRRALCGRGRHPGPRPRPFAKPCATPSHGR